MSNPTDPIGPGTKAWEASDRAIIAGKAGDEDAKREAIDEMTRELIAHNASVTQIADWEGFVRNAIADPDFDETLDGDLRPYIDIE